MARRPHICSGRAQYRGIIEAAADDLQPDRVPLKYSIAWLICAVTCGQEAVMVSWPGAIQDHLPDGSPCSRPRRPGVPQGPG
jgi:hypothetical protein